MNGDTADKVGGQEFVRTITPTNIGQAALQARTATLSYFGTNVARLLRMNTEALHQRLDNSPFLYADRKIDVREGRRQHPGRLRTG